MTHDPITGRAVFQLPIPNDPGLVGVRIGAQGLVLDPAVNVCPGRPSQGLSNTVNLDFLINKL